MNAVRLLALASTLLLSTTLYSACDPPPEWQGLECQGGFNATNIDQLNSYITSPGIRTVSGVQKAKNLIIDFDVEASNLSISTPCSITVKDGKNLNISGNFCVNSKDFKTKVSAHEFGNLEVTTKDVIRLNNSTSITATGSINLLSKEGTVVVHPGSNISAVTQIKMESQSGEVNPYVTIRENVTLTAPNIHLIAPLRTPIGSGTVVNASDTLRLTTTEEFHTSAWKSAIFNVGRLRAESADKLTLIHRPAGTVGILRLDAPSCYLGSGVDLTGMTHQGSCFLEQPHAVISSTASEGAAPFNASFDMGASTGALDRIEVDFGDGTSGTFTASTFTHNYTVVGEYTVKASYFHTNGQRSDAYLQVRALPPTNTPEIFLWVNQVETGGVITTMLSLSDYPAGLDPSDVKYFHYDLGPIGQIKIPQGAVGTDEYGALPVNYPQAGEYPVTLTLELHDGTMVSTGEQDINVWDNTFPVPVYTASSNSGNAPLTVNFSAEDAYSSDGTPIAQYRWRFPDGEQRGENLKNISYTFTEPGFYSVRLRIFSQNGNRTQVNIPVYVGITPPTTGLPPMAFIRADQRLGTAPHLVNFTGSESFDPEQGSLNYEWEFEYEEGSSVANPSYTFENPGVYFVSLKVTDPDNNENMANTFIYVNDESTNIPLDFVSTHNGDGNVHLETYFLEGSQAYDPQSYIWRFNLNGEKITQVSGSEANIQLPGPGSYDVSLTGRLVNGPYQTIQKTLVIDFETTMPEGYITQTKDIFDLYEPVILDAVITNQNIDNLTFKWFTDGNYFEETGSAGTQFVHQFDTEGVKTVNLIVEDQNGFSILLTQYPSVEIIQAQNNPPYATLEILGDPGINPAPVEVTFDASGSYDGDGFIVDYFFDFGTGETYSGVESVVSHVYQNSGNFTTTLVLTDNLGAQTTIQQEFSVKENEAPIAFFDHFSNDFVAPATVQFSADIFSYDADGQIVNFKWGFGTGDILEGPDLLNVNYTYNTEGIFRASLEVTDDKGATSIYEKDITILNNHPPVAILKTEIEDTPNLPRNVTIDASESYDEDTEDSNSLIYAIKVDGIEISQSEYAQFSATEARDYEISLFVTDSSNQTTVSTKTITNRPNNRAPVANFTLDKTTFKVGEIVIVDASTSQDEDGDLIRYEWNWGNSSTSEGMISSAYYLDPGVFQIKLVVIDVYEARNEIIQEITIEESSEVLPIPKISFADKDKDNLENPIYVHGLESSSNIDATIVRYAWDLGDGTTFEGPLVDHKYSALGQYQVRLTVEDEYGQVNTGVELINVTSEAPVYAEEERIISPVQIIPVNIQENGYNSIPTSLELLIENGLLKEPISENLHLYINHNEVSSEYITYQAGSLFVDGTVIQEGVMSIELNASDSEDKTISYFDTFAFGEQSISVTVVDNTGNPIVGAIVYALSENEDKKFKTNATTNSLGTAQFSGLHSGRNLILASQGDAVGTIFLDQITTGASYTIQLEPFAAELYSGNNDFSENFRGWSLSNESLFSIETDNESSKLNFDSPDGEEVWYRKIINSSDVNASSVSHSLEVTSNFGKYHLYTIVRSLDGAEIDFSITQIDSGKAGYNSVELDALPGTQYEVLVTLIPESEPNVSFLDFFIGKSFANSSNASGSSSPITINSKQVTFYDYNRTESSTCEMQVLKGYISTNFWPLNIPKIYVKLSELGNCSDPDTQNIYPLGILLSHGGRNVALYRPEISQGYSCEGIGGIPTSETCSANPGGNYIPFALNFASDVDGEYLENTDLNNAKFSVNFVWAESNTVTLETMNTTVCNTQGRKCVKKGQYAPLITYPYFVKRYNDNDANNIPDSYIGGDHWVSPMMRNLMIDIVESLPNENIKFGDASNAHGGLFSTHGAHKVGKNVDFEMRLINHDEKNINREMYYFFEKLFELFDENQLNQVGITETGITESEFGGSYSEFKSRMCLSGVTADTVILDLKDHNEHLHLQPFQGELAANTVNIDNAPVYPVETKYEMNKLVMIFEKPPSGTYFDFILKDPQAFGYDRVLFEDIPNEMAIKDSKAIAEVSFMDIFEEDGNIRVEIEKDSNGSYLHEEMRSRIKIRKVKVSGNRCDTEVVSLPVVGCQDEGESFDENIHLGVFHPNGGGFVSRGATVSPEAYIGPNAIVCADVSVGSEVRIDGKVKLKGAVTVNSNTVIEGGPSFGNYFDLIASDGNTIVIGGNNSSESPTILGGDEKFIVKGSLRVSGPVALLGKINIDSSGEGVELINSGQEPSEIFGFFESEGAPVNGVSILGNTTISGLIDVAGTDIEIQSSIIISANEPIHNFHSQILYSGDIIGATIGTAGGSSYFALLGATVIDATVLGSEVIPNGGSSYVLTVNRATIVDEATEVSGIVYLNGGTVSGGTKINATSTSACQSHNQWFTDIHASTLSGTFFVETNISGMTASDVRIYFDGEEGQIKTEPFTESCDGL